MSKKVKSAQLKSRNIVLESTVVQFDQYGFADVPDHLLPALEKLMRARQGRITFIDDSEVASTTAVLPDPAVYVVDPPKVPEKAEVKHLPSAEGVLGVNDQPEHAPSAEELKSWLLAQEEDESLEESPVEEEPEEAPQPKKRRGRPPKKEV